MASPTNSLNLHHNNGLQGQFRFLDMNKQWEKMDDDYESVITRVHVKYHEDRKKKFEKETWGISRAPRFVSSIER